MDADERMAELEEIALERFVDGPGKAQILAMLDVEELKEYAELKEELGVLE